MSSRRHRMDRQVSIYCSKANIPEVAGLLEGDLHNLPPISSRTVRVFLSSTFSDMTHERNALMEYVYSKLKKLCRNTYGLEFHVMDLRWGIRDESHNDHTIIDACLDEIENCNSLSIGPTFVALLGDKYGYRPFPPNIKKEEFELLRQELVEAKKDVSIIDRWFKIDNNTIPPMYRLVPINTILPNFNPQATTKEQQETQEQWNQIFRQIQNLLRCAAEASYEKQDIDVRIHDKYFVSVTEYEIYRGLFNVPNPSKDCLAFYRCIDGLDSNLENRRAAKFTDLLPGTTTLDTDARHLLTKLKDDRVPNTLKRENIKKLSVEWTDPDKDPTDNEDYLKKFCDQFEHMMIQLIRLNVAKMKEMDSYVVEVVQHLKMCVERCKMFRGREEIVAALKTYLTRPCTGGQCREPLVVYGESGSGKTSILAKAASMVQEWMTTDSCKPMLVLRFLGFTARSSSIRIVLGVICWHVAALYGRDIHDIPTDYLGLVAYFHDLLPMASAEKPLVIILDSLDQLGSSHNAHDLTWLPKQLPPHVYLIVSTLRYEHDLLETLKANMSAPQNFVEVVALGPQLGLELVREWLKMSNRVLTPRQYELVENTVKKCSLPLYTRLIFEEVCRWKSWQLETGPDPLPVLQTTVKGVINRLLDRVERNYGRTFVSHALSYMTGSRHGLGDLEIEDVLSLDDIVLNDVFIHWLPPVRRIPPLLWPRLHNELRSYIIQRESHGVIVYYWYHRQFNQVARERYLTREADKGHKLYIHSLLAHYFMGTWGGGHKKPFKYTEDQKNQLGLSKLEDEADRKVPQQPLVIGGSEDRQGHRRFPYHLRKLAELPYHLIESKRTTDLQKEVLFNYEWLHTKLTAMSIHDLLSDFSNTLNVEHHQEVQILANSLRICGSNLSEHANTLAFELSARLLPYYDQYRGLRSLLQSCDTAALKHSALLPLFQCFESPRGMLTYILEDHSQVVYDLLFCRTTHQLVSVSRDGSIGFWDMRTGERTKMLDIEELQPGCNTHLFQSSNGRYLICDSDHLGSPVYIFDMKTGLLKHRVGARTNAQRRGFIVGNLLCRQKNIINVQSGQQVCSLDDFVDSKEYLTCGITPNEKYILIGQQDRTSMFHIASKQLLMEFMSETMPCTFYITADSSKCYTGYSKNCLFRVLCIDPASLQFGTELLSFNYKEEYPTVKFPEAQLHYNDLDEVAVRPGNECVLLLTIKKCILVLLTIRSNFQSYKSNLIDVKGMKASGALTGGSFSGDGMYIMVCEGHFLHVWNVYSLQRMATVTLHSVDSFPIAVDRKSSLLATASQIHTAIKVWDLRHIQSCSGKQIELYENPLEHVVPCPAHRLVYIKKSQSQSNFKFYDYFGLDVWNMSTGFSMPLLPYGNYGQMEQLEASADGQWLAMLLKLRSDHRVVLLKTGRGGGKVVALCHHANCSEFTVCPRWEHLVTTSTLHDDVQQLKLWTILRTGAGNTRELEQLQNCSSPVFSLDGAYLFYIENGLRIVQYSLATTEPVRSLQVKASLLTVLPNKPQQLMVTRWSQGGGHQTDVHIWSLPTDRCVATLQRVAPRGILDVSKDGRYAIDACLQVYDLQTGARISELGTPPPRQQYSLVKLTYDGQYAIWADDRYVRVARVQADDNNDDDDDDSSGRRRQRVPTSNGGNGQTNNGNCIGYICTHEETKSLTTLDYGYIIVIGRQDGHVITARIVDGEECLPPKFKPQKLRDRTDTLLDSIPYPDGLIATFDPLYQAKPRRLADDALPRLGDDVRKELERQARIPHAIIKTPSAGNLLPASDNSPTGTLQGKNRRGSSPCISLWTAPRLKECSPTGSATASPSLTRRSQFVKYFTPQSPRTLPRRSPKKCIKHKSPSLTDLFNSSNKPPKPPKASSKTTTAGPFTVHNAMQNTGTVAILPVTDMSSPASSSSSAPPSNPSFLNKVRRKLTKDRRHSGGSAPVDRMSGESTASSDLNGNTSDVSVEESSKDAAVAAARKKRCSSVSTY